MSKHKGIGPDKNRIGWQDSARGIGIALVVFGHVLRGLLSGRMLPPTVQWLFLDFAIYTFHMPLFMFLTGLNVPHSLTAGRRRFLRSKVLGILYPYFLWSLLQGTVMALLSRYTNTSVSLLSLTRILWEPLSPFWFLYVVFVFCVAAAFFSTRVLLCASAVLFCFGGLFSQNSLLHQLLHFPLFFSMGMWVGPRVRTFRVSIPVAVWALVVACANIAVAWWWSYRSYNSVFLLPAAIGGVLCMIYLAQRIEGIALIAWAGRISLSIYVMHILTAAGTRIVLQKFLHVPHVPAVYIVTGTFAGIAIPMGIHALADRLGLLPALGLKIGAAGKRWINARSGAAA